MSEHHLPAPHLSALSPDHYARLLTGAADLVLVFDSNRRVVEVTEGPGMRFPGLTACKGQLLEQVFCKASRVKLPALLAENGADGDGDTRWRHVNLETGTASIPVLLRYFGFPGPAGGTHLLVGRDLRPTVAMQDQVHRALIDLEQRAEQINRAPAALPDPCSQVGSRPLPEIVNETARLLERLCLDEALRQSGGDRTAAAGLLGLDPADFDRLLSEG